MSSFNLLNTSTVNFQDLIGNGKNYKVPPYQRDYSWTEEQWEDLWLDIAELRLSAINRHYMGAVVVKAETDRQFLIIDGQQRVATLTILSLAVIKHLETLGAKNKDNQERATALRARYIGEKDILSLTEVSKLELNEHDNGFFQDYLVQLRKPINPKSLSKSNKLLWDCFSYFEKQIQNSADFEDGLKLAELLSEVVARRLLFILITVDDEINAYTVFETLNARGLELTTTDLLKNYLFSKLQTPSDLISVQRRWQRLIGTVEQGRFSEFLRYHYLTTHRQTRIGRLFKIARDEVKQSSDVLTLLKSLESRADLFDALDEPNHAFWSDLPAAKPYIRELALFKVRQMIPLLFAAYEKLNPDEFVKVLKTIVVISFRYTIIGGLNPNELEAAYHHAAKAVLEGNSTSARQVFESLRSIYVSDDKFVSDFAQRVLSTTGQRKKIIKYILCRLETRATGKPCDFETDPSTIEHILPENPSDDWEAFIPRERWEELVYRLGNLTLLSASANRNIGSKPYDDKKQTYETSEYAIAQEIARIAPEEWTRPMLEKRQKDMASRARHIWRSDFT